MTIRIRVAALCLLLSSQLLSAESHFLSKPLEWVSEWDHRSLYEGHNLTGGPQYGYLNRFTGKGAKQASPVAGLECQYQRLLPGGAYWGLRSHYFRGNLVGETGRGDTIRSRYYEYDIAARLGFTWSPQFCEGLIFAPFVVEGYLHSSNFFRHPSPRQFEEITRYYYQGVGALIESPSWGNFFLALDLEFIHTWEAESKILDDPNFGNLIRHAEDSWHVSTALPLCYNWWGAESSWQLRLVPSYRYRHLGDKENYPFNFIETDFRIYSLRLELNTCF